jgi:putative ABC transport system ATP-binding protein
MILECSNLNLIYDANKEEKTFALRNINLEFESNKLIGVIGPSGSGKSSLLYALAGLKKPTTGFVSYKGKDIGKMSDGERADIRKKEFGFIFQRHFLIDYMDIIHNVLTPLNDYSDVSKKAALKLMEALRIEHLACKKPYQLSVGQRQRVAIARALINILK